MYTKKVFSMMLLGAMCLGFVACENNEPEVNNNGTEQTDPDGNGSGGGTTSPTTPTYTVTLSVNDETMGTVAGAGTYENGKSATLTATANEGYAFYAWSDGSTENPRTVTAETTLEATFYAFYNGHHYVDLGLPSGLLWAVCNVGAKKMEMSGDYFAWGETEPKDNYNGNTLKYWNNNIDSPTKYTRNDGLVTLEAGDDAATVNWGGAWRTPKGFEQDELRTECTWTWITKNGKDGYEVAGKNGNSIFLPAAGYRYDSGFSQVGSCGWYWSSTVDTGGGTHSYLLFFDLGAPKSTEIRRWCGCSIRAVFSK